MKPWQCGLALDKCLVGGLHGNLAAVSGLNTSAPSPVISLENLLVNQRQRKREREREQPALPVMHCEMRESMFSTKRHVPCARIASPCTCSNQEDVFLKWLEANSGVRSATLPPISDVQHTAERCRTCRAVIMSSTLLIRPSPLLQPAAKPMSER